MSDVNTSKFGVEDRVQYTGDLSSHDVAFLSRLGSKEFIEITQRSNFH
jgi:hypothetical protein